MSKSLDTKSPVLQQSCVIPFRRPQNGWKFCLITSLKKKKWIFPKGVVEPGETLEVAGLKEAWEEAGLRGTILGDPVGSYHDAKWGRALEIHVLLMQVDQCADDWPEVGERQRAWMGTAATLESLEHARLKELFQAGLERLAMGG